VRIRATRDDGGSLWLATASSVDARAVLGASAVSTATGVHFPTGTLDLRRSGSGALPDIRTADVWRLVGKGAGSTELTVDQGRGPETAVVTSGDASALKRVTVTVTWAERSWFFEALGAAVVGAIAATFAIGDLLHNRRKGPLTGPARGVTTSVPS